MITKFAIAARTLHCAAVLPLALPLVSPHVVPSVMSSLPVDALASFSRDALASFSRDALASFPHDALASFSHDALALSQEALASIPRNAVASNLPRILARHFALLCTFACMLLACHAPGVQVPAGTPASQGAASVYLWAVSGEGTAPTTFALANDGTVLSQMPGIHIYSAGTEWTSEVTVEDLPTTPCEEHPDDAPEKGRGVRVRLVPADTRRAPLELVVPPADGSVNQIEQSARVLASLGPYVFVEESTYEYTCGAHGNTGFSFAVWNIDEGRRVDLLAELPDWEALLAEGKRAIDARSDAVDFSRPDDPPAVTELLPRIGPRGGIQATALVTVASCYACTDGGWSSYTVSTEVPSQLPWRLRALGTTPNAVVRFRDAHRDLTVGGYSFVR